MAFSVTARADRLAGVAAHPLDTTPPNGDDMTRTILVRRGRATVALGLTALALSAGAALAATAGDLDTSFDGDGKLVLPFKISPGHVLPESDGKVLMTDEDSSTVVRLAADGSLDRSFDGDGIATGFVEVPMSAAALQPDGKLVVAGASSAGDITVARLGTDGKLDKSFGADGSGRRRYTTLQPWFADAMIVQPDGRMAIVGGSSAGATVSRLRPTASPTARASTASTRARSAERRWVRTARSSSRATPGPPERPTTTWWSRASASTASSTRRSAARAACRSALRTATTCRPPCSSSPTARSSSPRTPARRRAAA